MSELTEYFVRHYSLVLDSDENAYHAVKARIKAVTWVSGTTVAEYRAMSDQDKRLAFAESIGTAVLDYIEEMYIDAIKAQNDSIGALLIREIMITDGSTVKWAVGENYFPEDNDADEFFPEDDEDDDSDE